MKLRKLFATAAAVAVAGGVAFSAPSSAADTEVTFTVTNGALSVAAAASASLLDSTTDILAPQVTGTIATTVTDERNSLTGYDVNAASTNFTAYEVDGTTVKDTIANTNAALAIPLTSVNVDNTLATFTPTAGTTGDANGVIGTMVLDLTALTGNSTVSYDLGVTVSIPADTLDGSYSGVVTQTAV